jgi:phytoene synthase
VARTQAKNFYYSFLLLPPARRRAMCAIYAFMRYCDDLSDDPGATRAAIDEWRHQTEAALDGRPGEHPVWPAFLDTVARYRIPHAYFREMIDGVASDLEARRFETFEELYRYCYQVASVVGLTIIHIFGFRSEEALPLAEKCGVAFQLTNIIRDIAEDAGRGRVYLPLEDLRRFGVSEEQLAAGTGAARDLLRFQGQRARAYYTQAMPLVDLVRRASRPSLRALIRIYSALLERIAARDYDVWPARISLSPAEKTGLLVQSLFR